MSKTCNVEVKDSTISGAGRGLFACGDFQPGDLVLAVDRPLFAELDIHRLQDTCAWCFQRAATDQIERAQAASMGLPNGFIEVKACTGCRRISYCSKSCQSKAWKREHKYECKALAPKDRPDLPDAVRSTIKLLGRMKADDGKYDKLATILSFRPFEGGKGVEEFGHRNRKLLEDFNMFGFAAWKYAGEPKMREADSQAVSKAFVLNIMCNKFALSSPLDDTHLGIGFDPMICSANHSCDPNVVLVFNQPVALLRATRPIKKGEEMFMKYIDVTNPLSVRQNELQDTYYFSCQCPKCKKGSSFPEDTFTIPPEELSSEYRTLADKLAQKHEAQLSRFFVPASDETAQQRLAALQAEAFSVSGTVTDVKNPTPEEIKATLKMCIKSGLWKWTRQPVPQLCRQLFSLYIANGDPYRAFRLGCKIYFEITPGLYPQAFYPDRLIDTWAMSTVVNVLCGPMNKQIYDELMQGGVDLRIVYFGFLFDVHDNAPKMFGLDSPFGRVVDNTYKQIMAGVNIHESEIRDKIKAVWPSLEIIARSVDVLSL
ncbi:uncharacterized protein JN550_003410 [Neoarthrinium moseri]|uniref:uncharacterized protein n=1 Tax=Neoarthrinium moseri TaxID=1658444 RepID=UPI001FDC1171|nr:uncharacterized protein JN550_003410 [Neoarthrinium moseri]KAI1873157.1 hypothetical protein JN550_003410 [Neoarthrinium moseri]